MFLGSDIGAWLVLALGSAMAVGHAMALLRPPSPPADLSEQPDLRDTDPAGRPAPTADADTPVSDSEPEPESGDQAANTVGRSNRVGPKNRAGDRPRAPLGRSLLFIGVGLVAAIWALASLVS